MTLFGSFGRLVERLVADLLKRAPTDDVIALGRWLIDTACGLQWPVERATANQTFRVGGKRYRVTLTVEGEEG